MFFIPHFLVLGLTASQFFILHFSRQLAENISHTVSSCLLDRMKMQLYNLSTGFSITPTHVLHALPVVKHIVLNTIDHISKRYEFMLVKEVLRKLEESTHEYWMCNVSCNAVYNLLGGKCIFVADIRSIFYMKDTHKSSLHWGSG